MDSNQFAEYPQQTQIGASKTMNFQINDIVILQRKHLYWVQQGSCVLNAVVDSTDDEAEQLVRGRVLSIRSAPAWGNILILAVENENPPENAALAAKCISCERI